MIVKEGTGREWAPLFPFPSNIPIKDNKSRIGRVWGEDEFLNGGFPARLDNSLVSLGRAVE